MVLLQEDYGGFLFLNTIAKGSVRELVILKGGEVEICAKPLRSLHLGVGRFFGRGLAEPSSWVLEMFSFRHLVGVSCDGYESNLMNLFAALEIEWGLVASRRVDQGVNCVGS